MTGGKIALTGAKGAGLFAFVDPGDVTWLSRHRWQLNTHGYAQRSTHVGRQQTRRAITISMARAIWEKHNGPIPRNLQIDHVNGRRLDNCLRNLRLATHAQNRANQRPLGGTSIYKGVSWARRQRKWQAHIRIGGKSVYLGYFHSEIAAANAYDDAAIKHRGEFARLNVYEVSPSSDQA